MRRILVIISFLMCSKCLIAQETKELTNADGVFMSYSLVKIDSSSSKKDKYSLEVVYENKNDYDLAYLVTPPTTNGSFTLNSPSFFAEVEVANALSIFGQSMTQSYSIEGSQINLKTTEKKLIYILPKGRKIKKEFKIPTKKDVRPVISGNIKQRFYQLESLY